MGRKVPRGGTFFADIMPDAPALRLMTSSSACPDCRLKRVDAGPGHDLTIALGWRIGTTRGASSNTTLVKGHKGGSGKGTGPTWLARGRLSAVCDIGRGVYEAQPNFSWPND